MIAVAGRLQSAQRLVVTIAIWGTLAFLCSIAALAIKDYQDAQLERVHEAGMAIGASLCRSGS